MKQFLRIIVLSAALLSAWVADGQPLLKVKHFGAGQGLGSPSVNCLAQDHDGFIWIGSNMGLTRFDGIHFHTFPFAHEHEGAFALQPRRIAVDGQNRIWVSTRRGLFVFDSTTGEYRQPDQPAEGDSLRWEKPIDEKLLAQIDWNGHLSGARSMLTDSEGGVWIGSFYEGLFYLNTSGNRFECIAPGKGDTESPTVIRPICKTATGNIYVGTENKGLYLLQDTNEKGERLMPVAPFQNENIQSLAADGDRLWVATFRQGIYLYHTKDKTVEAHFHTGDGQSGLTQDNVVCLLLAKNGDLMAGTTNGIFVHEQGDGRFRAVSGAAEGFVHALAQTSDGTIWAGSLNQPLLRIVKGQKGYVAEADTVFTHPCVTSLLSDDDTATTKGQQGSGLWIGTDSKGVWRREANGSCHATLLTGERMGSSANVIATDGEGRIWVSTFNGLFCMDDRQQTVSRYSQANGLPTNFFNYASACVLEDGQMLMGTHNGLVAFSPLRFQMPRIALRPHFTNIRIGNRDTIATSRLTLDYDAPSVTIDYAVPTYAHQPEVWYRHQVGNEKWTVVQGGEGRIYFSHLSSGNYVLRLQASMNPNAWEGPVAEMLISVSPPWWRTSWAFLFYALLAMGVTALLWRLWRQKREHEVLRQQIARLLDDQELMRSTPQMSPYALIKDIAPHDHRTDDFMEQVDSYLDGHLGDRQLSVDTLAGHLGMSASTFYRRMKSSTSFTPNEYIRLCRLKKAALMLRQEGLSIREVSERLCFSSVAYFTNCFSHQFGITPGEYVKSSAGDEA
jgi:ligand-binding sensor domain-containing protein/AraC-like DNA-binding protein